MLFAPKKKRKLCALVILEIEQLCMAFLSIQMEMYFCGPLSLVPKEHKKEMGSGSFRLYRNWNKCVCVCMLCLYKCLKCLREFGLVTRSGK